MKEASLDIFDEGGFKYHHRRERCATQKSGSLDIRSLLWMSISTFGQMDVEISNGIKSDSFKTMVVMA